MSRNENDIIRTLSAAQRKKVEARAETHAGKRSQGRFPP